MSQLRHYVCSWGPKRPASESQTPAVPSESVYLQGLLGLGGALKEGKPMPGGCLSGWRETGPGSKSGPQSSLLTQSQLPVVQGKFERLSSPHGPGVERAGYTSGHMLLFSGSAWLQVRMLSSLLREGCSCSQISLPISDPGV